MEAIRIFDSEMEEHLAVLQATSSELASQFAAMLDAWARALRRGGKVMLFGNGGSAADAQHIATELTVRFSHDRRALPAIALTADAVALTATGNDLGFERVFARQVEALGRPDDLAVGISTSGRSPNVIAALAAARDAGIATAAFTGGDGGEVVRLADTTIVVPSRRTSRIQEMHITLGHALCAALEVELGFVDATRSEVSA